MTQWIKSDDGTIIDTPTAGITVTGTYYLNKARMDLNRPFVFGASVRTAGHTAFAAAWKPVNEAMLTTGWGYTI